IFAYKSELDAWWDNGRQRLEGDAQTTAARGTRRLIWPAAAAGILLVVGGMFARHWLRDRSIRAHVQPIAVLPLASLSQDPGQDYLADGLTEARPTNLGKLGALPVTSRTPTARYKR